MTDLGEIANEMLSVLECEDGVQAVLILRDGKRSRSQVHGFDIGENPIAPVVWLLSSAIHLARASDIQVYAFRMKGEGVDHVSR